jgi:hypothetical protein
MTVRDLEHSENWVSANAAKKLRCSWRLWARTHRVQGRAIPPQGLNAPTAPLAAQKFGAYQPARHGLSEEFVVPG